jgi:ribonucleoside-diphosphate reductase alpha chain
VDGSISKTINAPKGYSVEQVKKIYEQLYEKGAKGGTVYVDGSRDFQVLSLEKSDNQFED